MLKIRKIVGTFCVVWALIFFFIGHDQFEDKQIHELETDITIFLLIVAGFWAICFEEKSNQQIK